MGKPPKSHEIGLIIKYDPVREVDIIIISLAYLKVINPNGIVNNTSKKTNDQTECTSNIEAKIVLTKAPRINPKTKLIFIITCANKKDGNVDKFSQPISC